MGGVLRIEKEEKEKVKENVHTNEAENAEHTIVVQESPIKTVSPIISP